MQLSSSIQQKVNAHMVRLFNKQAYSIPSWNLLYSVVKDAQINPTVVEKHQYAYELYWALKDLFKLDYNYWFETLSVDDLTQSVDIVEVRSYMNVVGPRQKQIPFTHKVDPSLFLSVYAGKSLDELNQNPEVYNSIKLDKYRKKRSLTKSLKEEADDSYNPIAEFSANMIEGGLEKKIDSLFAPVTDAQWDKPTFEEFVENKQEVNTEVKFAKFLRPSNELVLQYIRDNFRDTKPGNGLTALLLVLEKHELLTIKLSDRGEQTSFHEALTELLGKIGGRQGLFDSINVYERTTDPRKKDQIATIEKKIATIISSKSAN